MSSFLIGKSIKYNWRRLGKIVIDVVLIAESYYIAYLARFDGNVPVQYLRLLANSLPLILIVYLSLYLFMGVYKGLWKYASIRELVTLLIANTFGVTITFIACKLYCPIGIPGSVLLIFWLLVNMLAGGSRLLHRIITVYWPYYKDLYKRVLIIGCGDAGEMILRQMLQDRKLGFKPVALLDDDANLHGTKIHGLVISGGADKLGELVKKKKIDEVLLAVPSASAVQMRRLVDICREVSVPFRTLPGPREIVDGNITLKEIRSVKLEDLLERVPIKDDGERLKEYFIDKSVLVTGAAGSIGSELCRQIMNYNPKHLIMLDRDESALFYLEHEFKRIYRQSTVKTSFVISDITNKIRLSDVFLQYKPYIVFHAAAYKHVPFMEQYPEAAVLNNVFGTINVSEAARKSGAEQFVLVSTDKAVNPSCIMGATKRLTELYCVSQNGKTTLNHNVVRFGNVLGSQGSIVPLFQEQIKAGGPVTVTNSEMTRFFMTIPEAAHLVLHAGGLEGRGNIYILDMGSPINIYDMAEQIITLSGFEVGNEIDIEIIGSRPGEKLHEELWYDYEKPIPTDNEKILKSSYSGKYKLKSVELKKLKIAALRRDVNKLRGLLYEMVESGSVEVKQKDVIDHQPVGLY